VKLTAVLYFLEILEVFIWSDANRVALTRVFPCLALVSMLQIQAFVALAFMQAL